MTDARLAANGNLRVWWVPSNGFANWQSPTAAEINAGTDITDAISWNDFGFGAQASDTTSDPALSAKAKVNVAGTAKYGGKLSFYYPGTFGDSTNLYNTVWNLLHAQGTQGYIVIRIDGNINVGSGTGIYPLPPIVTAVAADFVHVFFVQGDGASDAIVGEDAFRYTINFLPQGQEDLYTVVRSSGSPVVAILPLTGAGVHTVKSVIPLAATVSGRPYTRGVTWTSSNTAIATVSANGIVTIPGTGTAGSVNITCTHPETGTASTAPSVITVT